MDDLFSEYFATSRVIAAPGGDIARAAQDLINHFQVQGYQVNGAPQANGGWFVSLSKGDMFRALLGLKTALNVRIEPTVDGVLVRASIGIFDLQIIPTIITVFVFAPVVFAQIWGIIQQNKLDEEAVQVVEQSLIRNGGGYSTQGGPVRPAEPVYDKARADAETELGKPVYEP